MLAAFPVAAELLALTVTFTFWPGSNVFIVCENSFEPSSCELSIVSFCFVHCTM